jgi:hypothetical protein
MSYGDGKSKRVGPYGTNEGDTWLGTDSEVGRMLMERDGMTLAFEMMCKDGVLQECMYVTENQDLIAEATRGHELYVAAQAAMN